MISVPSVARPLRLWFPNVSFDRSRAIVLLDSLPRHISFVTAHTIHPLPTWFVSARLVPNVWRGNGIVIREEPRDGRGRAGEPYEHTEDSLTQTLAQRSCVGTKATRSSRENSRTAVTI